MSGLKVSCPGCGVKLKLKRDAAGRSARCSKCGHKFRVPSLPSAANSPQNSARSAPQAPQNLPDAKIQLASHRSRRKPAAKKKPPADDAFDDIEDLSDAFVDESQDEVTGDQSDYDDFNGAFEEDYSDGFDDGYRDVYGNSASLPTPRKGRRKKKKKTPSVDDAPQTPVSATNALEQLQERVRLPGSPGWFGVGITAAVISVFLTLLAGFTNSVFLISVMSLVTGALIGFGIQAAMPSGEGRKPAVVALLLAFAAIMMGKCGAFCVLSEPISEEDIEAVGSDEQGAAAIREDEVINVLAQVVQEEYLTNGKISQQQVDQWQLENYEDYEAGEDDASHDFSSDYLPIVWEEAERRWFALSAEQQQEFRDRVGDEIFDERGVDQEQLEDLSFLSRLFAVLAAAWLNLVWPIYSFFMTCGGLFAAFKLAVSAGSEPLSGGP